MSGAQTDPITASPTEPLPAQAEVVVFLSAKGGCGSTLLACNAAADLAQAGQRVCLLDLDLCKGDVGAFLDLQGARSVNTLIEQLAVADSVLVHGAVEVHSSGLHVLAQPYDLAELNELTADEVRRLIGLLSDAYDVVIIDAGSRIDVASLAAAQAAQEVLLIATPDVPALRDARRVLTLLHRLGLRKQQTRLVLNKVDTRAAVGAPEAAEQLGVEVLASLPWDEPTCRLADTRGEPLFSVAPRARLTLAARALWDRLHGEHSDPPRRSWFWIRPSSEVP